MEVLCTSKSVRRLGCRGHPAKVYCDVGSPRGCAVKSWPMHQHRAAGAEGGQACALSSSTRRCLWLGSTRANTAMLESAALCSAPPSWSNSAPARERAAGSRTWQPSPGTCHGRGKTEVIDRCRGCNRRVLAAIEPDACHPVS